VEQEIKLSELVGIVERAAVDTPIREVWRGFLGMVNAGGAVARVSGTARAAELADTYGVRLRHLREVGWETGGFAETVGALSTEVGSVLGISFSTQCYHALCFFTPDLAKMVGFLYLRIVDTASGEAQGDPLLLH